MPAKKQKSYKFSQKPPDSLLGQLFREAEDNFISIDKDGNVVIDKDIHCRSIFVDGDSVYINGIKLVTPKFEDDGKYWQYSRTAKEVSLVTKASPVVEEVQDIVGAMLAGNTETFITVTYQDSDGTIDFVVPVLDEDDMATNSATQLATQQSIRAYADTVQRNSELFAFFMG